MISAPGLKAFDPAPASLVSHAMNRYSLLLVAVLWAGPALAPRLLAQAGAAPADDAAAFKKIADYALTRGEVYTNLYHLCKNMPGRISGNADSRKAVAWTRKLMESYGFDNVRLQPCVVPTWERGKVARAGIVVPGERDRKVSICALGGSVPTPRQGVTAEVLQVDGTDEIRALPKGAAQGKIIFINRKVDPTCINPYSAYMAEVVGRVNGVAEAARAGAAAVVVRSITYEPDVYPHTGYLTYYDGTEKIPAASIASLHGDWLAEALGRNPRTRLSLKLDCKRLPDTASANVIGEWRGTEFPNEVVVVGAHLDSWDLGEGAHDDGGGCLQAVEALRIIKNLGLKHPRTLRVVLYENEENGLRGSKAYGEEAARNAAVEKHIFALETDCGAFAPIGFGFSGDGAKVRKIQAAKSLFVPYGLYDLESGGGGFDIQSLAPLGTVLAGLRMQGHRYFDYHHTQNDVFEAINKRELELGAASMAMLLYWVSEHGL